MNTSSAPFANHRDALLELYSVGEEFNPESLNAFGYAYRLAISLRLNTITIEQYDSLAAELKFYCEKFGITTKNEICSLF